MNRLPPSLLRQDWHFILVLGSFVWLLSFWSLLIWSWSWYTQWPALSVHLKHWLKGFISFVFNQSTAVWLNYWQTLLEYDWHWPLIIRLVSIALIANFITYFVCRRFYVSGGKDGFRHISGPYLYRGESALKHAKQVLNKEGGKLGIKLHPRLTIAKRREEANLLVVGIQGGGKTVVLTPIIEQVISRGERAFIYDEKREFTALFYKEETCILLAPWDERSAQWNIQKDAHNDSQAQLIAERLIKESQDPLWSNGARMIFAGMVIILNNTKAKWGWKELSDMLSMDESVLHTNLKKYYPRAARFIVENSKTTQSFFAQLLGSLGWLYTLSNAWPNAYDKGFCIEDWITQPAPEKPVLIVQADKRYVDIGAPLANALIALMTSHILSQTNSAERELWLFIDEFGNLPKNPSLCEWMSLGRSKGCRIVAGIQSVSQIKKIYDEQEANALLNMFTMFISMRVGAAGENATYCSKVFGERMVERPSASISSNFSESNNWQSVSLSLVNASDIVHLPQPNKHGVNGYLLIPGYNAVYRLLWPYTKLPTLAEEHCPAQWLSKLDVDDSASKAAELSQSVDENMKRIVDKIKFRSKKV